MRLATSLLLLLVACTDHAAFRPTQNVTAVGYGGQPAAAYEIRDRPDTDPTVYVNVWSHDATRHSDTTSIDLTMSVRNVGAQPVALESGNLELEPFSNEGRPLPLARLAAGTAPQIVVGPGQARDVRIGFVLPVAIDPDSIGTLRLRWTLDHDGDQRYTQFTEFARVREQYATGYYYDPIFGWYDPFLYPHAIVYRYPVQRVVVREHRR